MCVDCPPAQKVASQPFQRSAGRFPKVPMAVHKMPQDEKKKTVVYVIYSLLAISDHWSNGQGWLGKCMNVFGPDGPDSGTV